jgi:hypothetical protein
MNHGLCRRCPSTRHGQDLLKLSATEAFTQETVVTDTSATNRIGEPQGRKIGQSGMPNRTIRFLMEKHQLLVVGMNKKH